MFTKAAILKFEHEQFNRYTYSFPTPTIFIIIIIIFYLGVVPAVGHFLPDLKILDLSNNQFEGKSYSITYWNLYTNLMLYITIKGYVPSLVREFLEYSTEDRESSKDDLESLVA